jgi:hypothetical protein
MFVVKLLQGAHRPLYLSRDFPHVTWNGERERAKAYPTKGEALKVAEQLRSYGSVAIEARDG